MPSERISWCSVILVLENESHMKAWLLSRQSLLSDEKHPLVLADLPVPVPTASQILIRVICCGVCHTEIDEIEGRTPPEHYPVVPGHQVIGHVVQCGEGSKRFRVDDRVGVGWIYLACGECEYCRAGLENLCKDFKATGRDANGGYAEYMVVDEKFAYLIPEQFTSEEAAPLLCAGAIGYRSLKLANISDGDVLGLTGFGGSGHLVLKMAKYLYPTSPVFVFARNIDEQEFARSLGADWSGEVSNEAPQKAAAIIDTTPVWKTVTASMLQLKPGGRLIINAIRKESVDQDALLAIRYQDHLWMEKEIKTVANIVRKDIEEFLLLAAKIPIKPQVKVYSFEDANEAIADLRNKGVKGSKVLYVV